MKTPNDLVAAIDAGYAKHRSPDAVGDGPSEYADVPDAPAADLSPQAFATSFEASRPGVGVIVTATWAAGYTSLGLRYTAQVEGVAKAVHAGSVTELLLRVLEVSERRTEAKR